MIHRSPSQRSEVRPHERRETPRVQAIQSLHGHIVTVNAPMRVRELSLGGFSIESPFHFDVDNELDFQLSMHEGEMFRLRGRVAYCRRHGTDEPLTFITGFSVIDDGTGQGSAALEALIDEMTAALSFDVA